MKMCPKCNNLMYYNSYFRAYYCSVCGEYHDCLKQKTNQEWLQSLGTEELADELVDVVCGSLEDVGVNYSREYYKYILVKWLKEEYKEQVNE